MSPRPSIYVAAPYMRAEEARRVHDHIRDLGAVPVSSWAENATGPEDLSRLSPFELAHLITTNDRELSAADLVLVLAYDGEGAEMFAEVGRARTVIWWIGTRRPLSAYRREVTRRFETFGEARESLARWIATWRRLHTRTSDDGGADV